ncbi:MAG: hypothetical protein AB7O99_04425 [Dongiaceae bacterium]
MRHEQDLAAEFLEMAKHRVYKRGSSRPPRRGGGKAKGAEVKPVVHSHPWRPTLPCKHFPRITGYNENQR